MWSKLLTLSLTLSLLPSVFAADRVSLDQSAYRQVRDQSKFDDFRVYISKKVKIERKSSVSNQTQIDAGISRESIKKIQSEKLGTNTRGKIIATSFNTDLNTEILFVSFDKTCVEKKCSYIFSRLDGLYKLFAVPNYEMDQLIVRSKKSVLYHQWDLRNGTEYGFSSHHALFGGNNSYKHRPILEYKLSESDAVVRDRIQNNGW